VCLICGQAFPAGRGCHKPDGNEESRGAPAGAGYAPPVHFHVEQPIAAGRPAVEEAFVDPAFYRSLGDLDALAPPEVLECEPDPESAQVVLLRVRYRFKGNLSPAVRRVIDPARLTWVDVSRFDRANHLITFHMEPDNYPDRLWCEGTYRFDAPTDGSTVMVMDGEVRVSFPLVGGLVERAVVTGMRQYLATVAKILAGRPAGSP
jgi:Protein of unknown function (DUF2505)